MLPITALPNPFDEELTKSKYFAGKMKFTCEGIWASKELFLLSISSNKEKLPSLILNAIVVSVLSRN